MSLSPFIVSRQLQMVTQKDADGAVTEVNAYRYYVSGSGGPSGALEYMFGDASYARLTAAGYSPFTSSNAQVAPYADEYFTYNGAGQAAGQVLQGQGCSSCSGGLGTITYAYASNTGSVGYNDWSSKTTETLPDGTVDTDYYNAYGGEMLAVTTDATTGISNGTFTEFDGDGRAIMTADPAAVELPTSLGTLEAYPDLLNNTGGGYEYLADNAGEITTTDYYATTSATSGTPGGAAGYVEDSKIQEGQDGTPILQESMDYIAHSNGTGGSGAATIYPMADDTTYGGTGGSDPRKTSYAYTWYADSTNMKSETITLPVISSGQNGPGVADTPSTFYDTYGRPIWTKDANGNIGYTAYDDATGAVVDQITSVNYARTQKGIRTYN